LTLFLQSGREGGHRKGEGPLLSDGKGGRVRQTGMGVKFSQIASVDSDRIKLYPGKLREGVAVAIKS